MLRAMNYQLRGLEPALFEKLFDLDDLACERVDTVLVNDVLACSTAAGPVEDCVTWIETASRAAAKLVK